MNVDLTASGDLLISRYGVRPSGRVIRNVLATVQALMGDPINTIETDIDAARGQSLDNIGSRLGFTRPPITATDIPTFGYSEDAFGYDFGVYATSRLAESANLPLGPMSDANYRRMLKARGIFLRSRGDRNSVEAALLACFSQGYVRVTEQEQITNTQSVSLVGAANVNGDLLGLTAAGHRYVINPFNGSLTRLAGDLPARTYSSLAFSEGDLFAVSGNQYHELAWLEDSVAVDTTVTMTGMPDGTTNVSGPVKVGATQYVATPTTLYSIDTNVGGAVTSIGTFSPATDIRALAAAGDTLYAADASGAIRTVAVTDAKTALYHSTGSTAVNALLHDQGALYGFRSRSMVIVDTDIKDATPAYTAEVGHTNAFFLASFLLYADRLVPSPVGVRHKFRIHRI